MSSNRDAASAIRQATGADVTEGSALNDERPALTDRQRRVLEFIKSYQEENGYPPTMREIAGVLGISSTNGVNDHLVALSKKGYLRTREGVARGIHLLDKAPAMTQEEFWRREAERLRRELGALRAAIRSLVNGAEQ